MNEISDFSRQYQYHQLKKPSGVEVEIPVHKALAMDLLKGGSYRTPPGSDRVKGPQQKIEIKVKNHLSTFLLIL